MDKVLDPGVVGIAGRRRAVEPTHIVLKQLARPIGVIEERVRKDIVSLEIRMKIAQESVSCLNAEVGLDSADC